MPDLSPRPLAEFTTLRVGGTPHRLVEARTCEELTDAVSTAWAEGEPLLVVGGGSNLFPADEPFDGTVVLVRSEGIERVAGAAPGSARLRVQAGHNWDDLVAYSVEAGLAGIEGMSGIPGTVGAAPVQNIGAYGQELVETLVEVELLDEATGDVSTVSAAELGLGFRTSVLKHHYGSVAARSGVILTVTLDLAEVGGGEFAVRGEQLRTALGLERDAQVSLAWIRETVLATRARKGMVLDDADADTYSAGSFFQNLVIPASLARSLPEECPRWPMGESADHDLVIPLSQYDGQIPTVARPPQMVKVSAAWLIENSGLRKGFSLPPGTASLSTKHALALTNRGTATAEEVAQLARFVQQRVLSEFGLLLQPEPVLVGVEL